MHSILVGLDGSDDCVPAVELGIRWAKQFDCLLVGVGVVDEPTIRGSQPLGHVNSSYLPTYNRLLAAARHNVERTLEAFALRCSEEQVASKLLQDEGEPCERITTELQRYDLLILGSKTHFRHAGGKHPCKTLENVLHSAPRPLVVAPQTNATGGRCVVIAYDGSPPAARALHAYAHSGLAATLPIHIVSVHPESSVEAAKIGDRAAEFLRFQGLPSKLAPIVHGSPSQTFMQYAAEQDAAMIVMGAYGRGRLTEFFVGSTTCSAIQESRVPLFLYH